jgi:D-sedoheptulose 7-phosphate isomerase
LSKTEHAARYLADIGKIASGIDPGQIDRIVVLLREVRRNGGRLFCLGVGGGAAYASHAVSDFRKIAGIECYSPSDNIPELTARINDDGWQTAYANWLCGSRLNAKDALFVFSVGGGSEEKNISVSLVKSLQLAKQAGAKVGDEVIVVPTLSADTVTAYTESFQSVLWHCIVSHPDLKMNAMKWESET